MNQGNGALASISAGRPMALSALPPLGVEEFGSQVREALRTGGRVSALFGAPAALVSGAPLAAPPASPLAAPLAAESALKDSPGGTLPDPAPIDLYAIIADDARNRLLAGRCRVEGGTFPSLSPDFPQLQAFEREIAEQYGALPLGHPWFKPLRFHRSWTGRDAWGREAREGIRTAVGDFYRVEGESVHEVAVGPVHAGVIEPGHFRFQCHGEEVFHLEIALGYQHRGVESAMVREGPHRRQHYAETAAGDTSIGHALAYSQVAEALGSCRPPARAEALRGIALELERLANHVGDLGALAGDVGFLPTMSFCGRIRGDLLNMTALICGNRFGRGLVLPGGVGFDLTEEQRLELLRRLEVAGREATEAISLLWNSSSVMARFEDTGVLSAQTALELGVVGPAARASGLGRDLRCDQPSGIYRFAQIPVSTCDSGDVFARAYTRALEIEQSLLFLREQLESLPSGTIWSGCAESLPESLVVALCEGWRGEICHVAITDATGGIARYKIVDPSFHNWPALAQVLRGEEISDFPLCNKSFNLSYCGHDL